MKLRFRTGALIASAALMAAAPASAHRAWFLPSTFTLSGDEQWITIDGAISNDLFFPNHHALSLDSVTITAPDGTTSTPQDGWSGKFRSTFDLKLDKQGTYRIASGGGSYFARWEENGEGQRRRGSLEQLAAEGLVDNPDVTLSRFNRRVETYATLGAPTEEVFTSAGEGIELQPLSHPNDIYTGEQATFGFLLDGEAAAGLEVEIVRGNDRYRDDPETLTLTTDENGEISFTLEQAGRYWLETGSRGETTLNGKTIEASSGYVLTFEALPL